MQRRNLLKFAGLTGAIIATSSMAQANQPPLLSEDDPIAKALGYKADANTVDLKKYPKRAGAAGAQQFCDNCALYQAADAQRGGCAAVPGKHVTAKGWCGAWAPTS